MKPTGKIAGIAGMVLGALVSLTPFQLAPVCNRLLELTSGKMVHMRCYYTGQTEVFLGIIALIIGLLIFISKNAAVTKSLGLVLALIGVTIIIIPTNLGIGVCMKPMECHATAKVLYVLGGLLVADGLLIQASKGETKDSASK